MSAVKFGPEEGLDDDWTPQPLAGGGGYVVVSWCVVCGWSTDDPRAATVCACDDGVPKSCTGGATPQTRSTT